MGPMTPIQKRAERRKRNSTALDMNLVSLIDVFTILIFFLLANSGGVELLTSPKAVKLPASQAETPPRETVVVVVSPSEILVDGRTVASVQEALGAKDDLIGPLKAELDFQASRGTIREEKAQQGRTVTILGDKDIPYQLLRKVMYTAARANFADVSFAVRQKGSV